ncbi:DUF2207 domain-containing protein [Paraliobacillus sediminis]|uniref:DUF2207 domain-containing protein n=1 Tax=Paraliobacillus sediminis TaxID=1885916 RepID=UPI0013C2BAB9|nr:DUF2207 domain-containing protein [Paraliobacillus sediminis]
MKKYLILLILFFSVLLLLPMQAFAVDFEIKNTQIDAYLQENGDVQVDEQHIYQFSGDFNGITRTLIPKENTMLENVEASENDMQLDLEQDGNLYKIYRSGSDETIIIDLSYTIKSGIEVYSDLAQFYWPFFDSSNESTYQNIDVYIYPPQATDDVLALGYDEAEGTSQTTPDGIVHFAMGEVDSGSNGDIRVAYDASLFSSADIIADKTIRDDFTAEITAYEEKVASFEDRKDMFGSLAPFVIGAFAGYLLALVVVAWRKRRKILWEIDRSSLQNSFLPKEEMSLPATILFMKGIVQNGEIISAALLNLVRKGILIRKSEREFVEVNKEKNHIHESLLISWLFYTIGSDGRFSVDDLDTYIKDTKNQQAYQDDYMQWIGAVKEEMNQHKLDEKKVGFRWTVAITSLLLIPLTILFGIHQLFMWMFFSIILMGSLLLFAAVYQPLTVKGARIKQQWKQFGTKYEYIDEKQWSEWMNDEQMQAFIYAIGTNNKSMLAKNEKLVKAPPNSNTSFDSPASDMFMLMLLASTMTNSFNEADQTISAATDSGSVSGGGAGVGGGGGGSGAF